MEFGCLMVGLELLWKEGESRGDPHTNCCQLNFVVNLLGFVGLSPEWVACIFVVIMISKLYSCHGLKMMNVFLLQELTNIISNICLSILEVDHPWLYWVQSKSTMRLGEVSKIEFE